MQARTVSSCVHSHLRRSAIAADPRHLDASDALPRLRIRHISARGAAAIEAGEIAVVGPAIAATFTSPVGAVDFVHISLQRKEPRCAALRTRGTVAAPLVHAQRGFQATAKRFRFELCGIGTFEVPELVGFEADPEWYEHDIRPVPFYDSSVFGREPRKFLIHQYTSVVLEPVLSMGVLSVWCSGTVFELVARTVIFLASPPAAFLLWGVAEQNAQFLIDLIAPFDELSCTRELVVKHGHASK